MNDTQQRILWAAAVRSLADAIEHGLAPMPTSVDLWTQYVTPVQLLEYADRSAQEPLKVRQFSDFASITIPTGQLIDLPISWTVQAATPEDTHEREIAAGAYQLHNTHCVPNTATCTNIDHDHTGGQPGADEHTVTCTYAAAPDRG